VKILYGYPGEEMIEAAGRNEIALGGCIAELDAPNRECLACGHQWVMVRRSRSLRARGSDQNGPESKA
jgi:hypothetical protein